MDNVSDKRASRVLLEKYAVSHYKHYGFILGMNFLDCSQCRVHAHEHMERGTIVFHGYDEPGVREVSD